MWDFLAQWLTLIAFLYLMALICLPSRFTKRIVPLKTTARIFVSAGSAIKRSPQTQQFLANLFGAALVIGGIMLIGGLWQFWDKSGYHPHTVETFITAKSDWLEGESKICSSQPLTPDASRYAKVPAYDVTTTVTCDSGELHQINVTFWGRTRRPEQRAQDGVNWKCIKKPGEFVCYALN